MATQKMHRRFNYWNGSSYSIDGDGQLAIPNAANTDYEIVISERSSFKIITNPLPSTLIWKTQSNYFQNLTDVIDPNTNPNPNLLTITNTDSTITLTFDINVYLGCLASHIANWSITSPAGGQIIPVTISSVVANNTTVTLSVSEQTIGIVYTLNIPADIASLGGAIFLGPYAQTFTGAGTAPVINYSKSIDARIMEIGYSEAMDVNSALNPANYSISPTLSVTGVTQISPYVYWLHTARQVTGTSYTVTINNSSTGVEDQQYNKVT